MLETQLLKRGIGCGIFMIKRCMWFSTYISS